MKNKLCKSINAAAKTIQELGIKFIFGVPGAKIDLMYEGFRQLKHPLTIIPTRHEQNAMFMASAISRITDEPQLVLTTSGAGTANLAGGIITSLQDCDPVLCISGNVPLNDINRKIHQVMNNAGFFYNLTPYSYEIRSSDSVSETIINAYRKITLERPGPAYISFPVNIQGQIVDVPLVKNKTFQKESVCINKVFKKFNLLLEKAKFPVILVGRNGSTKKVWKIFQKFLAKTKIPVVSTLHGVGAVSKKLKKFYFGTILLWKNRIGDAILKQSDLIITLGVDLHEESPNLFNPENKKIIYINNVIADYENFFSPDLEIIGNVYYNLIKLTKLTIIPKFSKKILKILEKAQNFLCNDSKNAIWNIKKDTIHPILFLKTLEEVISEESTVICDIGSLYLWTSRFFHSYLPRKLLLTNGAQTMGIGLPWAIGAGLVQDGRKPIISLSGDGGFCFSMSEFILAVQLNLPIIQIIWKDGYYDMVKTQQIIKYNEFVAVNLGENFNYAKYAEVCGGYGFKVNNPKNLKKILEKAIALDKPVIIEMEIDYSDNKKIMTPYDYNLID